MRSDVCPSVSLVYVVVVQTKIINTMYPVTDDIKDLSTHLTMAIDDICQKAAQAANDNYQLIVLSDKKAGKRLVPIRLPSWNNFCFVKLQINRRYPHRSAKYWVEWTVKLIRLKINAGG